MRDREETRCCCAKCGPCVGTIYSECNCRHQARGWQNRGAVERERLRLSRASPPLSSLKPNHVALCITVHFTDFSPGLCWGWGFFFQSKAFTICFCASPTSSLKERVKSLEPCKEQELKEKKKKEKGGGGRSESVKKRAERAARSLDRPFDGCRIIKIINNNP